MNQKEKLYMRNKKLAKVFKVLAPISFWVLLVVSIILFSVSIKNSLGNLGEIVDMLETSNHTGDELQANYDTLVEKYGEWVIGSVDKGFEIKFINVKNAVFNGFAMITCFFSGIFLVSSIVLGKWVLPALSEKFTQDNQDMANLTILKQFG